MIYTLIPGHIMCIYNMSFDRMLDDGWFYDDSDLRICSKKFNFIKKYIEEEQKKEKQEK